MMKKKILAVLAAACLALTASGCGQTGSGTESGNASGGSSVSGKVVIYTSMYEDIIENMEKELEKGWIIKGETLEDLVRNDV